MVYDANMKYIYITCCFWLKNHFLTKPAMCIGKKICDLTHFYLIIQITPNSKIITQIEPFAGGYEVCLTQILPLPNFMIFFS